MLPMPLGPDLFQAPGAENWKKLAKSLEIWWEQEETKVVTEQCGPTASRSTPQGCWATPPHPRERCSGNLLPEQTDCTRGPLLGGLAQARGALRMSEGDRSWREGRKLLLLLYTAPITWNFLGFHQLLLSP